MKQLIFSDVYGLINQLKTSQQTDALIAIDGWANVGKSWLARKISSSTNYKWIDLDDFLIRDQRCFLNALRYADLRTEIEAEERQTLVSGVCVLGALSRLDKTPHIHIYIKRMAKWGWPDALEIEEGRLEEVSKAEGKDIDTFPLPLEMRAYHQKYRPQDNADMIFERLAHLES